MCRPWMISGNPGTQVICSTRRFCFSHAVGFNITYLPLRLYGIWIGGSTPLTLSPGHNSRVGTNRNWLLAGTA
jgi:hypothetical protein